MQFAHNARVLHFVRHRHRIHKTGDGFVIESNFTRCGACGYNFAPQLVDLERGARLSRRGILVTCMATGQRNREQRDNKKSATHTSVYNRDFRRYAR